MVNKKYKKEEKRVCVICKKEINEKGDYLKAELYKRGKLSGTDFAHQICWLNRNQMNTNLGSLVNGLTDYAKTMGFIKEKDKEMIIQ